MFWYWTPILTPLSGAYSAHSSLDTSSGLKMCPRCSLLSEQATQTIHSNTTIFLFFFSRRIINTCPLFSDQVSWLVLMWKCWQGLRKAPIYPCDLLTLSVKPGAESPGGQVTEPPNSLLGLSTGWHQRSIWPIGEVAKEGRPHSPRRKSKVTAAKLLPQ